MNVEIIVNGKTIETSLRTDNVYWAYPATREQVEKDLATVERRIARGNRTKSRMEDYLREKDFLLKKLELFSEHNG